MKIIISPAKKMKEDDKLTWHQMPALLNKTKELYQYLREESEISLKKIWNCNDKIARENIDRLHTLELDRRLTPAILAYVGIQYQYMSPEVFSTQALAYLEKKLRILSGLYGILRPFDGVIAYRLEMQSKINFGEYHSLYDFWQADIYKELMKDNEDGIIINLASKEYSKVIEPYLSKNDSLVTPVFGELKQDKVVQKGTLAKMARGEMVRFMAENRVENLEDLEQFTALGFEYDAVYSDNRHITFLKK